MAVKHLYAEIKTENSEDLANQLAEQYGERVREAGGAIWVAPSLFGDGYTVLLIDLPVEADQDELLPHDLTLKVAHTRTVSAVEDQGIR